MTQIPILTYYFDQTRCVINQDLDTRFFYGYVEVSRDHPYFSKEQEIQDKFAHKIIYNCYDEMEHMLGVVAEMDLHESIRKCCNLAAHLAMCDDDYDKYYDDSAYIDLQLKYMYNS